MPSKYKKHKIFVFGCLLWDIICRPNKKIDVGEKEYEKVKKKADLNERGFDLMNLKMPEVFNEPKKEVKTIKEIWFGDEINHVRKKHTENSLEDVKICKGCPFKETYDWMKLN